MINLRNPIKIRAAFLHQNVFSLIHTKEKASNPSLSPPLPLNTTPKKCYPQSPPKQSVQNSKLIYSFYIVYFAYENHHQRALKKVLRQSAALTFIVAKIYLIASLLQPLYGCWRDHYTPLSHI